MNKTDQKLINDCDRTVRHRRSLELQVARKTISILRDAGFALEVTNDERQMSTGTDDNLIEWLFECDQAHLLVSGPGLEGWVFFVLGNDGWDVISDYTVNLERWIQPVMDFADTLS